MPIVSFNINHTAKLAINTQKTIARIPISCAAKLASGLDSVTANRP